MSINFRLGLVAPLVTTLLLLGAAFSLQLILSGENTDSIAATDSSPTPEISSELHANKRHADAPVNAPARQLPNGTVVDHLLREFENGDGEALDANLVAAHFTELIRRLKAGDSNAARLLHQSLAQCKDSYSPEGLRRIRLSAIARHDDQTLRSIAAISKACSPFSPEQIAADWEIVKMGIELGDNDLRVQYYSLKPGVPAFDSRYSERLSEHNSAALEHLNHAAADGFPDSYWALGDAYMAGTIVPRDYMRAYGYQLAWLESQRATFVPSEWEAFHSALVRQFSTLLTAEQQSNAQFLATRLLFGDNS